MPVTSNAAIAKLAIPNIRPCCWLSLPAILQDYGMLTIVNQQLDVTALQVQQCRKCCVRHSLSSTCTEQWSAMLLVGMHLSAND